MAADAVILLVDLSIIIAAARLLGNAATRLGQPRVVGELSAGLLLGPTLLGRVVSDQMFGDNVRVALSALATIGLVLFVFMVGYELDQRMLRSTGRTPLVVAVGSLFVPAVLGTGLGWWLAGRHDVADPLPFALFIGVAMGITAFPVLARILTDRRMAATRIGNLCLASAAIDDVLAWGLLAGVITFAGVQDGADLYRIALAVPYVLGMFYVVRPLLRRLAGRVGLNGRLDPGLLTIVLIGLLLSCAAAEWIGTHYIIGAFLFGVVMPRTGQDRLRKDFSTRIEWVNNILFVPVFFAIAGLNVDLSRMPLDTLGELGVIIVVAMVAKLLGAYPTARSGGLSRRESLTVATLMNTRGLTEIVVLTIGLQAGLISQVLYSMMVVMALVTTAVAGPLLVLLKPERAPAADEEPAAPAEVEAVATGAPPRALRAVPGVRQEPAVTPASPVVLRERRPGSDSAHRDAA